MNKTKNKIVEAALMVFSSKGYGGCTMDDVAAAASVAKGTLYYHFKSKDELFNYVVTHGLSQLKERIEPKINKAKDSYEKVNILVTINIEAVYYNKELFRVMLSQLFGDEIRQIEIRKTLNVYLNYINTILLSAMQSGTIKKDNPDFLTHIFFGAIMSVAIYDLNQDGESNIYEITEKLTKYILNTLKIDN